MDTTEEPESTAASGATGPPTAQWVTLAAAADHAGVSVKTARRRVTDGRWPGEKREGRWWVDVSNIQPAAIATEAIPVRTVATDAEIIPVAVLERLEAAWQEVVEQRARAEVLETKLDFEVERRQRLEGRIAELEAISIDPQTMADMTQELRTLRQKDEGDDDSGFGFTPEQLKKFLDLLEAAKKTAPATEEPLPDIPDSTIEQMTEELGELRQHRQDGQPSEPWWPLPDEAIEEVGQDLGEIRRTRESRPLWHRILFRRQR